MVLNPDKCLFMLLGVENSLHTNLVCRDEVLKNTKEEKVFAATLDNKLNFATHLLNITKNANKKFNTLTRVRKYMNTDQKIVCIFLLCPIRIYLLSVYMDVLFKMFPSQNKQYT